MPNASAVYSCVVDAGAGFALQARIWVTTLRRLAEVDAADLFVHLVERGGGYGDLTGFLRAERIAFRAVAPFGDGRFCNKLRQLETPELAERPYAVLCDADLAFSGPLPWAGKGPARAGVVDGPNPPLDVLARVYARAGRGTPPARTRCGFKDAETYADNCNGGLYVLARDLIAPLRARWQARAEWLLARPDLLGTHAVHVDQVAFALAMHDLGAEVELLPPEANFPTHLPADRYDPACPEPVVLHHHGRLTAQGRLRAVGLDRVDRRIGLVNAALAAAALPRRP